VIYPCSISRLTTVCLYRLGYTAANRARFPPEIDAQQHRLTIHGLVDRPLSLSMDDLKRLPSVSRVHFLECQGNSSDLIHHGGNPNMGLPVQYVWGMTSCSEWTGVPLSVLLFAEPKRKPHQNDSARDERERRHQENALDEALKDTFPASAPVSFE
jgi:DMSO/TMAO reductase YedYZ molybdopterin-dependent catalytic subunit